MEFIQQKTDRATVPSLCLHVKSTFQKLCKKIEGIVGPAVFKSKDCMDEILSHQLPNSDHNHQWMDILLAYENSTGGFISGDAFLEGGRIWIWGYYLSPALITHSQDFQVCCS